MDHLYTPWRMTYLQGDRPKAEGCVFCAKVTADDEAEHIVARGEHVYVTLNLFPYNNGHLMVIPYAHIPSMEVMAADALTDLMLTTNKALAALRAVYNPHAFNIGANLGAAAGAGIAEHFHLHVVPRWSGDTNFMTVTADTRIIPDSLAETWRKLQAAWK